MPQVDDLSRSLATLDQDATLTVVVEMSEANWLVAGMVPGAEADQLAKALFDGVKNEICFEGC